LTIADALSTTPEPSVQGLIHLKTTVAEYASKRGLRIADGSFGILDVVDQTAVTKGMLKRQDLPGGCSHLQAFVVDKEERREDFATRPKYTTEFSQIVNDVLLEHVRKYRL
jgi:hypothetical protein